MPNVLLTNHCNQKCSYCFAEEEMRRKRNEISLKDFEVVLNFLEKSEEKNVRLMGGEPTLHPEFKKIINYTLFRGFDPQIFTNGLFSPDVLNFLNKKKGKIKYSFNLNPPEDYSSSQWKLILNNLEILSQYHNSLIGRVVWQKNFNIDCLLNLAEKFPVKIIMLRLANPIINQKNQFAPLKDYPVLAKNIVREIKKTGKNRIRIGFGCGFAKEMFDEEQLKTLKEHNVANLKWGCKGNNGRFDIGTDLSAFRCFPLSDWEKKKLTDFKNIQETEKYFYRKMKDLQGCFPESNHLLNGPCFSCLLSSQKLK